MNKINNFLGQVATYRIFNRNQLNQIINFCQVSNYFLVQLAELIV